VTNDEARADRRALLSIGAFIVVGALVRLVALGATGFALDVSAMMAWAERLAAIGPASFYEPGYFTSGYPPGFLYVLWGLGALLDGEALRIAIKAASIPADVAIAAIVAWLLWRRSGRGPAVLGAALWSLSPAAILAGPYWGQIDAVGSLAFFGALLAAGSGRWGLAGALAALAAMTKPQFGITGVVLGAAAAFEFIQRGDWRPAARAGLTGLAVVTALALPYRMWLPGLAGLVREASDIYPYTSLYAFNIWSIFTDFWKPDDQYVLFGAVLLAAGLAGACVPLWWRRDTAMLLTAGVLASAAFYLLPTRAHERYIFPAFVLLLPLAAARVRVLAPYLILAAAFPLTLYFALTRYPDQNRVTAPGWLELTLFSRNGQIALALIMCGGFALLAWRLIRGEARFEPTVVGIRRDEADVGATPLPPGGLLRGTRWTLPAGLAPGRLPTRRDITVALLIAIAVLVTRGYRLDWPREMYFDEVYHARTAFELLAQRDPYEWTHPHLAKQIMALGILAFGDDRVVGHDPGLSKGTPTAFAVANDGIRAYGVANEGTPRFVGEDFEVVFQRPGQAEQRRALGTPIRAVAIQGDRVIALTDGWISVVSFADFPSNAGPQVERQIPLPFSSATALSLGGDRVIAGGPTGLAILPSLGASPILLPIPTVAVTAKTDGTEIYALDPQGVVHVIAADTAKELRALTGGRPGTAIAYALGSNRVFVARADAPILDVFELETGSHDSVSLANARTGTFSTGATALALVPRTDFLYALDEGRVVVVETHGSSPYASVPVTGNFLGVDGEGDKLVVAGAAGADLIETGRHALAWRLPGVIVAALLAFLLVLIARRLFASAVLPAFVGLAVLMDGSMFAQARIGMNDIYVGTLIVAGWYFVIAAHRPRRSALRDILIAGLLFGLALAAKWAGAYTLIGLLIVSIAVTARAYERGHPGTGGPLDLLARRGLNALLLFVSFAVIPVVIYLASYLRWFGGPTIPYGWNLIELTQQMYWYHSNLTAPHAAGSPWWSWPLVLKPVYWYFGQSTGGDNAYIYDAGNVVLFWTGLVAFFWCAVAAVRARSVPLAFVVFAGLVQYVAWIPIGRVLFFYHFFTVLPFYLLALAAWLALLWETGRVRWVIGYFAAAAAAFVYFYPFVSGQPVPGAQAGMFFILPTWTYDCQFYPTFVCDPKMGSSFSAIALFGRVALAIAVAATVAVLIVWSSTPMFSRLLATVRSGMRR
jgi:predicted membrane-bound dolichyl-phosphate-mannose-protein mannosyltransferase